MQLFVETTILRRFRNLTNCKKRLTHLLENILTEHACGKARIVNDDFRKPSFLHFISADPEMGRLNDLFFLLHFNIFANVHSPIEYYRFVICFSRNRLSFFTLSFLKIPKRVANTPLLSNNVVWTDREWRAWDQSLKCTLVYQCCLVTADMHHHNVRIASSMFICHAIRTSSQI